MQRELSDCNVTSRTSLPSQNLVTSACTANISHLSISHGEHVVKNGESDLETPTTLDGASQCLQVTQIQSTIQEQKSGLKPQGASPLNVCQNKSSSDCTRILSELSESSSFQETDLREKPLKKNSRPSKWLNISVSDAKELVRLLKYAKEALLQQDTTVTKNRARLISLMLKKLENKLSDL